MKAKQFEAMLARYADVPRSEVDHRIRPMRGQGLVPVGARGLNAPDIDEAHAAYMILAMVSRRAVDSATVAARAGSLKPVGISAEGKFGSLAHVIANALAEHGVPGLRRIIIDEDGRMAWTLFDTPDGRVEVLWVQDFRVEDYNASPELINTTGSGSIGRQFVIGGAALAQFGVSMRVPITSGWVDPSKTSAEA